MKKTSLNLQTKSNTIQTSGFVDTQRISPKDITNKQVNYGHKLSKANTTTSIKGFMSPKFQKYNQYMNVFTHHGLGTPKTSHQVQGSITKSPSIFYLKTQTEYSISDKENNRNAGNVISTNKIFNSPKSHFGSPDTTLTKSKLEYSKILNSIQNPDQIKLGKKTPNTECNKIIYGKCDTNLTSPSTSVFDTPIGSYNQGMLPPQRNIINAKRTLFDTEETSPNDKNDNDNLQTVGKLSLKGETEPDKTKAYPKTPNMKIDLSNVQFQGASNSLIKGSNRNNELMFTSNPNTPECEVSCQKYKDDLMRKGRHYKVESKNNENPKKHGIFCPKCEHENPKHLDQSEPLTQEQQQEQQRFIPYNRANGSFPQWNGQLSSSSCAITTIPMSNSASIKHEIGSTITIPGYGYEDNGSGNVNVNAGNDVSGCDKHDEMVNYGNTQVCRMSLSNKEIPNVLCYDLKVNETGQRKDEINAFISRINESIKEMKAAKDNLNNEKNKIHIEYQNALDELEQFTIKLMNMIKDLRDNFITNWNIDYNKDIVRLQDKQKQIIISIRDAEAMKNDIQENLDNIIHNIGQLPYRVIMDKYEEKLLNYGKLICTAIGGTTSTAVPTSIPTPIPTPIPASTPTLMSLSNTYNQAYQLLLHKTITEYNQRLEHLLRNVLENTSHDWNGSILPIISEVRLPHNNNASNNRNAKNECDGNNNGNEANTIKEFEEFLKSEEDDICINNSVKNKGKPNPIIISFENKDIFENALTSSSSNEGFYRPLYPYTNNPTTIRNEPSKHNPSSCDKTTLSEASMEIKPKTSTANMLSDGLNRTSNGCLYNNYPFSYTMDMRVSYDKQQQGLLCNSKERENENNEFKNKIKILKDNQDHFLELIQSKIQEEPLISSRPSYPKTSIYSPNFKENPNEMDA